MYLEIMILQQHIILSKRSRGFYLITDEVLSKLDSFPDIGILNLFIQHTSAGLTINENADPSVRTDFESFMNHIVPERLAFVTHDIEGDDDMPAHIKASLVGFNVTIPINNGRLQLGTWQGIYLCEFRDQVHSRKLIATIYS